MEYPRLQELEQFVAGGFCSKRKHPQHPLWIYNYTSRAQHTYGAQNWPEALRDARGLILSPEGFVVARGFRKFFNLSQLQTWPEGKPEFWEKADGSLILAFDFNGEVLCSTRGSFESPQAQWAATMIPRTFSPRSGFTYCFEAIYPGNRIVVDYGQSEELVLLAVLDRGGMDRDDLKAEIGMLFRAARFHGEREASELPHELAGEGFVLRWPCGTRAKVKLDEYLRVHRLIFELSTRSIWEMLRAGEDPDVKYAELAGDLRAWAADRCRAYRYDHSVVLDTARQDFSAAPSTGNRREFAAFAKTCKYPNLVFRLLDGKRIDGEAWKLIEPSFERPSGVEALEDA